MSRGPRDLRDLICVSRLTFRQSDDEFISDDEDGANDPDTFSLGSSGSCDSRQGSAACVRLKVQSPDSGCVTNGGSPSESFGLASRNIEEDLNLKLDLSALSHKKKAKKKKKKKVMVIEPPRFPFPKPNVLPPLGRSLSVESDENLNKNIPTTGQPKTALYVGTTKDSIRKLDNMEDKLRKNSIDKEDDIDEEAVPIKPKSAVKVVKQYSASHAETGNFEEMLCYMDATVVSGWLARANNSVSEIATYVHTEDYFIQFAHFWLTDFPDIQKREIFEMEIEILREELGFAFAIGRDDGKVSQHDISNLIGAIFREYPAKIHSSKGNFMFLDYLDTLTSEKSAKYKTLLSDVKCSTKNRQYAQWVLATRSFALISIWCAIVNFYRNLLGRHGGKVQGLPVPNSVFDTQDVQERRLLQALRHGFTDVIHYMNVCKHGNLHLVDSHSRTLIFMAVMYNQAKALQYLITRVKPAIDVNLASDTGNTALHAATNSGNTQLVSILLHSPDINVNCVNVQCEEATPLHLAVMHGHKEIVELLLQAGADVNRKMGDLTPLGIATDFEHEDILKLLQARA